MRVLQINAVCSYGSTGRIVQELHGSLPSYGIDSYIATPDVPKNTANQYKIGNNLDRKIHSLMSRITGKQAYFSKFATFGLIQYIKKIKPDIIHLHNLHSNYINLNMLLKFTAKYDIAVSVTLHDCWFFTGKCTHYTMAKCRRWQSGCENCPRVKDDNKSWFFDRTKKMWSDKNKYFGNIARFGVIGVSDWITNEAKKSFLKNATVVKRIYNWIDFDVFKPKNDDISDKFNIPQGKFNIIVVGANWSTGDSKYNDLIKLSKLISEDMQIILVGSHTGELPDNIIKIGYVNDVNTLASLYSSADVYVHFSQEDTFGKVVAEALSCGTPAIVYNTTALPELIGDGCGYVVPLGNAEQIYEKICEVMHTGKKAYAKSCIGYTKTNFEKNNLIEDTVSFYQELYNTKKAVL